MNTVDRGYQLDDRKEVETMKLNELLTMTFTATTADHMMDLRTRLLNKGLIAAINQTCIYTPEAKREALAWYREQMEAEAAKGSTGWRGKWFEVKTRIDWSIARNTRYCINDVKCRPSGLADMRVKIDGANVAVEVKTGTGALVYGADEAECVANLRKLWEQNPLMVWVWDDEDAPMVMRVRDLLEGLEAYKGDIMTWLVFDNGAKRKDGQHSIRFQNYQSRKKLNHLATMAFNSYDWQTILETASFEE